MALLAGLPARAAGGRSGGCLAARQVPEPHRADAPALRHAALPGEQAAAAAAVPGVKSGPNHLTSWSDRHVPSRACQSVLAELCFGKRDGRGTAGAWLLA